MASSRNTCDSCGELIQPGDRFCTGCGAPLLEETTSRAVTPPPSEVSPKAAPPKTAPSRSRTPAARLILAVVVIVVVGIVVAAMIPSLAAWQASNNPSSSGVEDGGTAGVEIVEDESSVPTFDGTWTGEIVGDAHPYTISVVIDDDGTTVTATATYPEIPCVGEWVQESRTDTVVMVVEIMPDTNVCYDQVPITLTLNPEGTVFYSAVSGPYTITSTLTRSP